MLVLLAKDTFSAIRTTFLGSKNTLYKPIASIPPNLAQ